MLKGITSNNENGVQVLLNFSDEYEQKMINFFDSLSEKDRRRYAAIEAEKLGHGGIDYISSLFGCDRKTIKKGTIELEDTEQLNQCRVRNPGGGKKSLVGPEVADIDETFLDVLKGHTAGDPMDEKVKWTKLSRAQIVKELVKRGFKVGKNVVRKLLKKHGYVKRKALKKKSTGEFKERNRQFKKIARLRNKYSKEGNPVISVDTKKKERLGNLYRDGQLECLEAEVVFDHDYAHLSNGKVIPHSIYDEQYNDGMVNIGTNADTSEFACDSIKLWWEKVGRDRYINVTSLLILVDCGGSNSYRSHIFKEALQALANEIGIEIRIAHYPPYCSKWNTIEHRMFPHVTRAMSGVIFKSYRLVKELIENTTTETGLKVASNIINKVYEKGKKASDDLYEKGTIIFDKILGKLNYRIKPLVS